MKPLVTTLLLLAAMATPACNCGAHPCEDGATTTGGASRLAYVDFEKGRPDSGIQTLFTPASRFEANEEHSRTTCYCSPGSIPADGGWTECVTGDRSSDTVLCFMALGSWSLADPSPGPLLVDLESRIAQCTAQPSWLQDLNSLVVRNQAGELLAWEVSQSLVLPDHSVALAANTPAEFASVTWTSIGCGPSLDGLWWNFSPAALELRLVDGRRLSAAAGEATEFSLNGATYRLAPTSVHAALDGRCGAAAWLVYREDFIVQR